MLPRLELLGHTLENARSEFCRLVATFEPMRFDDEPMCVPTFDEFALLLSKLDISKVSGRYDDDHDLGEFFSEEIARRIGLVGKPWQLRDIGEYLENYSPTSILRLLCENQNNLGLNVVWYFSEHLEEEWAERSDFVRPLLQEHRFLLVTEGSSDSLILSKAFELRRPQISDFFYFVDMEGGYPFTGTGNLFRFSQGLAGIGLQNKTVVIYDNDAEGNMNFNRTRSLSLPSNMRVMRFPDRPDGGRFATIGPDGPGEAQIDGRAASLETYLDLDQMTSTPLIRWTNYLEPVKRYQGSLTQKEQAIKRFLRLGSQVETYDFSGIDQILDAIVNECVSISSRSCAPLA
jgi:hypothetical protein